MNDYLYSSEPHRFTIDSFNDLFSDYSRKSASDITVQSKEPIFIEIHGFLHKVTRRRISHNEVCELINSIYGSNATAHLLSGHDIDTNHDIKLSRGERYRFRINATSCVVEGHLGIQVTLRVIPNEPPELSSLDLSQDLLESLYPKDGVIYVTGATGSGKSTLLAAIIREIISKDNGNRKVLTYESPIEFVFDNIIKPTSIISQCEIPKHLPTFAAGVRNALRRKPGLILVGEARDSETISAVIEAAQTGHPVTTTLHSNGVAQTIRRLVNSFPLYERRAKILDIIETIRVIISQRLVPKVGGGRVALREYLIFDEKIRDILLDGDLDAITSNTRRVLQKYGKSMKTDLDEKYSQKLIDDRTYQLLYKESVNTEKDILE